MPELPEVETIARTLTPQVAGRCIKAVSLLSPKALQTGSELMPRLEGAAITGARRRAKLLLLDVRDSSAAPLILAFHLKMTGRLFVHPPETPPPKHTKLILELFAPDGTATESRLFFDDARTFGYCRIMRPEDLPEWPFWAALGPEPLEHNAGFLAARLEERNGQIKSLLLNQNVIAGIGNIYADESLFRAGIHPERKSSSIARTDLETLMLKAQEVLREAIAACGSSIRDYRDAEGRAGAFQNSFMVYGRGGEPCRRCGKTLKTGRVAGRGTVYCRTCQQ
ncbi:MAG: bifunctional DNA-formamidopyrimidine glycosylase/DNA-(apurinic or apyrimidinic site) lyase [Deltaproteobacteria bacterium]|nr:bifunctional DNA-formamidopyrimidine glycosylase/DNA-(apurinic or apyrimidinic site) lyase [Deltaproteobacteria bacterium]